jgi:cytochrome c553
MYKTFLIDGVRLETRLLEKVREPQSFESWRMVSFAWSEDQRSVTEVGPFGEQDVLGTEHDIPTLAECIRCHSLGHPDAVNGFSAIQLNHPDGGVNLQMLVDEGWLSDPIDTAQARMPGDALTQQALGYLHANCGSCHGGPEPEHGLDFIVPVGVTEVTDTPTWRTAVCTCSVWVGYLPDDEIVNLRIRPGDPLRSVAIHRMSTRVPNDQMPPIGTALIDPDGIRILSDWIASLDPTANGCPHGCPWP